MNRVLHATGVVAGRLDHLLGRFTMYRLVTVVLTVIAAAALLFAATGELDQTIFRVGPMLASLGVLLVATVGSGWLVARVFGRHAHVESSVITALLLWFLYWPASTGKALAWLAAAGLLATCSKYLIAWRRRHLVNPAAAAAVLMVLIAAAAPHAGVPVTTWWAASKPLFWFCAVGAFLVLYRTRRLAMGLTFMALAVLLVVWSLRNGGATVSDAFTTTVYSFPVVFLGGFMLSEPLTLPPRRWQQLVSAVVAAVVMSLPLTWFQLFDTSLDLGPFHSNTSELLFVVTGLLAFGFGQRSTTLALRERRPLGGDTFEYVFEADPPLAFQPGQYVELHVPHTRPDLRGTRRMLSIASAPGREFRIGIREPEHGSTFKRALAAMEPGARAHVAAVHGDFLWPADGALLLIAGGIGITPFISQLASDQASGRDVVLVYGVRDAATAPYREFLDSVAESGVTVHLVEGAALTAERVRELVPDAASRATLISGPPVMVDALRADLAGLVPSVHTDAFLGY